MIHRIENDNGSGSSASFQVGNDGSYEKLLAQLGQGQGLPAKRPGGPRDRTKKGRKPPRYVGDLWQETIAIVEKVGFIYHDSARNGETVYYRWSDNPKLLRISMHKRKKTRHEENGLVVSSVSFGPMPEACGIQGCLPISDESFENRIAIAIGRYFMKSAEQEPLG